VSGKALQDFYPDDYSWCYGCGRLNTHGLHVKTRWDGAETISYFTPRPEHMAMPGYVYGGLIASLIDCHAMGTASAAALRADGKDIGDAPSPRFVTAVLNISFKKPTPLGPGLEIRAKVIERSDRKARIEATLSANGEVTATGEIVAVRRPESMQVPR
jgi:acyl-coenzyme A thioesterase PaaI-like protein